MYGLILENLAEYIKQTYGEEKWEEIRRSAAVETPSFSTHQVYPEAFIPRLSKKAVQILDISERDFFDQMGVFFISFVSQYGYDRVLSVLGRHMRDFLNGLDNLHEYLKFSYPRMRAPSFICENETKQGLTLHYRSKRRGFVYYTMGLIREVARHFYHKDMKIELVREEILFDMVHVTFELTFDNRAFTFASLAMTREEKHLPISASVLFEIFPFCIVFGSDMVVRSIGNSLMVIMPDLIGKKITNWFDLVRPLTAFKFQTILNRTNNIFELVSVEPIIDDSSNENASQILYSNDMEVTEDKSLRLKGQMIYMDNWKMMMYLGTPVMPNLNSLINSGLYINDLSMHDFSRDLMLAGTQQSVELKLALDQEQQKSKKLEESMRKLDEEMRRTDELLYQMIPKQVADRLRKGENPIDTCEMFDSVSILFSDVVTFTEICSRIAPMEVVSMLNGMYSIFDRLTERNHVYKVETIGDAYMVVSGAPEKNGNHAERVCDMALDMIDAITDLKDPSTGIHLKIRVGVHSGAVVAGIVGLKMPRYCLFGDSVNTASRMESTAEEMKVHISEYTRALLPPAFEVAERGDIQVKGKGSMRTFWLLGKENRLPLDRNMETPNLSIMRKTDIIVTPTRRRDERRAGSYTPITFKDVARRSIANSPIKYSSVKESRSNSIGAFYASGTNPSDFFGSGVFDMSGENSSDLSTTDLALNSRCPFRARCTTAPPRTGHRSEVSLTPQGQPSDLPPGQIECKTPEEENRSTFVANIESEPDKRIEMQLCKGRQSCSEMEAGADRKLCTEMQPCEEKETKLCTERQSRRENKITGADRKLCTERQPREEKETTDADRKICTERQSRKEKKITGADIKPCTERHPCEEMETSTDRKLCTERQHPFVERQLSFDRMLCIVDQRYSDRQQYTEGQLCKEVQQCVGPAICEEQAYSVLESIHVSTQESGEIETACSSETSSKNQDASISRQNSENCREETLNAVKPRQSDHKEPKYEFGKSMHEYAKKLGRSKNDKKIHAKEIPPPVCGTSTSGHHHRKTGEDHHHYLNSHIHQHNPPHQQCCSGFGTGNRQRFQSNACVIF